MLRVLKNTKLKKCLKKCINALKFRKSDIINPITVDTDNYKTL